MDKQEVCNCRWILRLDHISRMLKELNRCNLLIIDNIFIAAEVRVYNKRYLGSCTDKVKQYPSIGSNLKPPPSLPGILPANCNAPLFNQHGHLLIQGVQTRSAKRKQLGQKMPLCREQAELTHIACADLISGVELQHHCNVLLDMMIGHYCQFINYPDIEKGEEGKMARRALHQVWRALNGSVSTHLNDRSWMQDHRFHICKEFRSQGGC